MNVSQLVDLRRRVKLIMENYEPFSSEWFYWEEHNMKLRTMITHLFLYKINSIQHTNKRIQI